MSVQYQPSQPISSLQVVGLLCISYHAHLCQNSKKGRTTQAQPHACELTARRKEQVGGHMSLCSIATLVMEAAKSRKMVSLSLLYIFIVLCVSFKIEILTQPFTAPACLHHCHRCCIKCIKVTFNRSSHEMLPRCSQLLINERNGPGQHSAVGTTYELSKAYLDAR